MARLDALTHLRTLGLFEGLLYLSHAALSRASGGWAKIERFVIVAQPVADSPLVPPGLSAHLIARQIDPGDPILAQSPRPRSVIERRYAQGAVCIGVTRADVLTGWLWLIHGQYEEDVARVRFVLPNSGVAAWDFDVYVAPHCRLGFTFATLWDAANAYLRGTGAHWSLSRISAFNANSLAAHRRLGARTIGRATFLIVGRLQIMFSSFSPRFHLSFGKAFPELSMPEELA